MKKKTIVILHGWGGKPENWKKVAELLAQKNYQVEIPYVPGFDKNNPIDKPYTLVDYSSWLLQYLNQKKIKKTILVGHSNGGRITSDFTVKYPQKVEKLVLIGCAGIPPKNKIKTTIFKIAAKFGKIFFKFVDNKKIFNLGQRILYQLAGESDYLNASPIMKKTMINMLASDLTQKFPKIKCKTLIIWGKNDRYTPLWMGKKIHQLIKNSKLEIIENGRHGLHFTHPKELVQLIINFLKV